MAQLLRAEVEGAGRLRLLRPRGLHPRPGQPARPRGDLRRPSTTTRRRPRTPTASGRRPRPRCPRARCTCPSSTTRVKTLDQTVEVDYYLPGCPPEAERIWEAIDGDPRRQAARRRARSSARTRRSATTARARASEKKIKAFKRTWEIIPDPETCLLEQGLRLLRHRHAGRLRRALPAGQLALHRLLRPERRRRGLRRAA